MTVRLVMFGRQGAGKGTQSGHLAKYYGAPHISTGDMLREAAAAGTPIGLKAKEYIDEGHLLPDEVMLGVIEERLAMPDVRARGFLLDGFPRTPLQSHELLDLTTVDVAINLEVAEEVVLERLSTRRICESCGRIYSVAEPPEHDWICDTCGGPVVQRDDDTPEAIAARLATYKEQTEPAISVLAERGLVVDVDGIGTPEQVFERLTHAIESRLAQHA